MTKIARVEKNEKLNGIEIYFSVYPISVTKNNLKVNGFRWNHKKGCWYAKASDEAQRVANAIASVTVDNYKEVAEEFGEPVTEIKAKKSDSKVDSKAVAKKSEKKNKFGVKVGDVFHMSWGYEQTNNDFFQVVSLVGESSVRVVEIIPKRVAEKAISPMSADYTYDVTECGRPEKSSWIDDQVNGDVKRLKSYNADGSHPQFKVTSYADASLVVGKEITVYDSWYY